MSYLTPYQHLLVGQVANIYLKKRIKLHEFGYYKLINLRLYFAIN